MAELEHGKRYIEDIFKEKHTYPLKKKQQTRMKEESGRTPWVQQMIPELRRPGQKPIGHV